MVYSSRSGCFPDALQVWGAVARFACDGYPLHVPSTGCYGRCAVSRPAADMSPALERVGG